MWALELYELDNTTWRDSFSYCVYSASGKGAWPYKLRIDTLVKSVHFGLHSHVAIHTWCISCGDVSVGSEKKNTLNTIPSKEA